MNAAFGPRTWMWLLAGLSLWLTAACASVPQNHGRELAGRTVVVTGASSGFGRGIAVEAARRGANVVLAARRVDELEKVAAEARAAGGRALVAPTDVSQADQVARLAEAAVTEFGRVDVWINNAGIMALGPHEQVPLADHDRVLNVNLHGVVYGSHHAMRLFKGQGFGTLINMGSVESKVPVPYQSSYVASKFGVLGLGKSLNQELRLGGHRNIKVVTIMPWAADTPLFNQMGNYTGRSPRMILLDPPEKIVRAVIASAVRPTRTEVPVGIKAHSAVLSEQWLPGLTERVTAAIYEDVQMRDAPAGVPPTTGNLYRPDPTAVGVEGGIKARMREEDRRKRGETGPR